MAVQEQPKMTGAAKARPVPGVGAGTAGDATRLEQIGGHGFIGQVIEGLDVVPLIKQNDELKSAKVV